MLENSKSTTANNKKTADKDYETTECGYDKELNRRTDK
jgi:hypothetical protein